jgi:hypothetical protein
LDQLLLIAVNPPGLLELSLGILQEQFGESLLSRKRKHFPTIRSKLGSGAWRETDKGIVLGIKIERLFPEAFAREQHLATGSKLILSDELYQTLIGNRSMSLCVGIMHVHHPPVLWILLVSSQRGVLLAVFG